MSIQHKRRIARGAARHGANGASGSDLPVGSGGHEHPRGRFRARRPWWWWWWPRRWRRHGPQFRERRESRCVVGSSSRGNRMDPAAGPVLAIARMPATGSIQATG